MTEHARLSARIAAIAESATLKVDAKAKALQAEGRPVISYAAGEPDFATPDYIVEAALAATRDPKNYRYTPAAGLPELREAVAAKTLRDSGLEVGAGQVVVTNGGKQAVYQAFQVLLDEGDEVLVPTPYWTTYPEAIKLAGGRQVDVFAGADQGYLVTVEQLEAARTDRTKVLLFVSPSNPTGAVYAPEQVQGHRRMGARARHLDRVRRDLPEPHLRRRRRRGAPARGVGRRGRARAREPDDPRQRRREDLRDDRLAPRLDGRPGRRDQGRRQPAVAPHVERVEHLAARRDRRAQRPAGRRRGDAPSLRPPPPHHRGRALEDRGRHGAGAQGAFYVYPDVSGLLGREWGGVTPTTSLELADLMLEQAEVAAVPGEAFGPSGYLRLSYALGDGPLLEGIQRLQRLFG